jgi:hypothetical protein
LTVATLIWDDAERGESELQLSGERLLAAVEEHIVALDGACRTLLTIQRGNAHLAIGGGGEGYVVYASFDNLTFHQLMTPGAQTGEIDLVAGAQPGRYPKRHVVELEAAAHAAKVFARDGTLATDLTWETEGSEGE